MDLTKTEPTAHPATLVARAIGRPDEPRHFMVVEYVGGRATARVGDEVVASSDRALLVKEVGRRIHDPVVYFPPTDVRGERLVPAAKTTRCPLKGTASYFDITGPVPVAEAAWSYQDTLDFDPRLTRIESCVAFDRRLVTVEVFEFETKEQRER